MTRVAVVTHARKEMFFLGWWSRYYGQLFGSQNLVLVKDGDDWDLPQDARFGRVIPAQFPVSRLACDAAVAETMIRVCAELLQDYDVVLRVDADEFLTVDPARGTWDSVLNEVRVLGYVYSFGLDIVQNPVSEPPLDPERPVLAQRRHAFVRGQYCKPCAISRPVDWTTACHSIRDEPVLLSSALVLVHLASVDQGLFRERLAGRGDQAKSSYRSHALSRERQFRLIGSRPTLDLDQVQAPLRRQLAFDRRGSPALSPWFDRIRLPDGTLQRKAVAVRLPDRLADLVPGPAQPPSLAAVSSPASGSGSPRERRLRHLLAILRPSRRTIIADLGAGPSEIPPHAFLLSQAACDVWGFEPQPTEFDRLTASAGPNEHYLPVAIGDGTQRRLHITHHPGFTSLLSPNLETARALNRWRKDMRVVNEIDVQTVRLDDVPDLPDFDLLKVDIQGGELDVFRHGQQKLASALAVVTEVAAIPLYQDQPLLSDQMSYLRGLGFELHKFSGLRKVAFRGGLTGRRPPAGLADQMSDSDAVFVRSLLGLERLESEALKHLCILADFVFESPSLALRGLELLVSRKEVSLDHAVAYRDMLFLESDGTQA